MIENIRTIAGRFYAQINRWDRKRKLAKRERLDSRYRSAVIVSIGGITVGGSGKTPLARLVAKESVKRGPVILLSRGYGRRHRRAQVIGTSAEIREMDPAYTGDEPQLFARDSDQYLIGIGPDRFTVLQQIVDSERLKQEAIIILDDGFQHYRMPRHLDLVILDETVTRTSRLIPAGRLREPLTRLKEADALFFNSQESEPLVRNLEQTLSIGSYQTSIVSGRPYFCSLTGKRGRADSRVVAVSGIARPERFINSAINSDFEIAAHLNFRDHMLYSQRHVRSIIDRMRNENVTTILTTEKDAVKLERFAELRDHLVVLPIHIRIQNEHTFLRILFEQIERIRASDTTLLRD